MIVVRTNDHPDTMAKPIIMDATNPYRAIILARRENLPSSGVIFLAI